MLGHPQDVACICHSSFRTRTWVEHADWAKLGPDMLPITHCGKRVSPDTLHVDAAWLETSEALSIP